MSIAASSVHSSLQHSATGPGRGIAAQRTARVLAFLAVAFLTFDTTIKVFQLKPALDATQELGFSHGAVVWIGLVELLCLGLYLVPRTTVFGAVLWTGYLGGAIAIHARLAHPLFSHTLFPIYVAIMLWLPLWLRDARVRAVFAAKK